MTILRADARALPLADASVDLIVTSPPYYALRSYTDGGQHYAGQIGSEATPAGYVDNLIGCTREWMRVLKPAGSLWLNLGDSYANRATPERVGSSDGYTSRGPRAGRPSCAGTGIREKSLRGLPWRYALRCIDDLGLILRAEVIWSKPNGLPESVTDRVRRSHETWFHMTMQPRYFSAVDEIRQPYSNRVMDRQRYAGRDVPARTWSGDAGRHDGGGERGILGFGHKGVDPLGALPGSVWEIATQPLTVPDHLGVDHFACVDTETEILTRRGWLRHDQVQAGDQAAGYDLDTGTARWTQVHAVHRYEYDGELVAVEKRDLSMRLTPNHRTIAQKRHGRHGHRGLVQVVRADELTPQHFIPRSAEWIEDQPAKSLGVDLAALCGWVAAEGWINWRRIMLSQSLDANPTNVAQIDALIRRLGGAAYKTRSRIWRGREWTDCSWSLPRDLSGDLMRLLPGKRLTWDFLGLPEDERRALLDAFIAGDGHARADGRLSIYQDKRNTITVDVLQAIAVTLGYKTTRTADGSRWVLYLTTGGRSVTLRGTNGTQHPIPREHYKGIVWCPTTGTGTFVARRNGRVFITGNSFPMEWPRRIILGWSPSGICTACGEGRRPVANAERSHVDYELAKRRAAERVGATGGAMTGGTRRSTLGHQTIRAITGEACACPETTAPTRPAVVLDPFGGTGTTALVARALGRYGISVDHSADYCRLAAWRTTDRGQLAKALHVSAPPVESDGQMDLFAAGAGDR